MATIKDIAKECGVSIATVSNVVNHTGRVSEKTVARVLETADRMGYVPDRIASNLKKRRTNVIGVITEDLTVFNTAEIWMRRDIRLFWGICVFIKNMIMIFIRMMSI